MTISIGALIGALLAIIILYAIVRALFQIAGANGWAVPQWVTIIVYLVLTIVCVGLIAWALGIDIPLFHIQVR